MTEFANPLDAVVAQVTSNVEARTQALHDLAKSYKASNGTKDSINKWIEESEDKDVTNKREAIKRALAKIAELKAELEAQAKTALVPDDYDATELANEFKKLKVEVKTLILQSEGVVKNLDANRDTSNFKEMLDNLPNISGSGLTASGRSPEELKAAREWLGTNGYDVKEKGRISADMLAAFDSKTPAE
jgi:small-conductance mechanosensitive channel